METWKRLTRAVSRTVPLYVRRLDYRHREFAVRHPTKGMVPICTVPREACYNPERLRNVAQQARHILNH